MGKANGCVGRRDMNGLKLCKRSIRLDPGTSLAIGLAVGARNHLWAVLAPCDP